MNGAFIKRKRITRIACIIALLLVIFMTGAHCVSAADIVRSGTCGDNLTWTLDSDGVLTIDGSGSMRAYSSDSAPWNRRSIKSVVINDGVTSIGNFAFYGCSNLTSITIPDSVTSIGASAFSGCSNLTSITIPDSVTSIWNSIFYGCSSLTSITISNSVTDIGSSTFYNCSNLTSITIPDSVTSIGNFAFYGCSNLTSITIPDGVTSIGTEAFYECSSLTSITIPDSVTSIGAAAFGYCSSLMSITIPDSVTSIENSAFEHCSSLTSITFPNNITSIENCLFWGCSSLTSITIPDSITNIGDSAFYNCSSLNSLVIPPTDISIVSGAFTATALKYVEFMGDAPTILGDITNSDFTWKGNGTTINKGPLFIVSKERNGWTVPLWNGYRTAYKGISPEDNSTLNADNYNNNGVEFSLDEASFTASVVGFLGNESGILSIPARVTRDGARYTVTGISDIIYQNMTDPVNLSKIIIGKNVSSISDKALDDLANAESIEIVADNESFKAEKGILYNHDKSEVLRVLRNNTQVSLPSSVTTICKNAFSGCISLENISLPNSIITIGDYAFINCSSINSLVIPNTVTYFGASILMGCASLETLTLPFVGGATKYGSRKYTFDADYRLLPLGYLFGSNDVQNDAFQRVEQSYKTGYYAYNDPPLSGLNFNIFVPDDRIDGWHYYIPTSLRSVTVTGGSLYYGAFYNCSMIEEITLGKDVVFTGERAFYGCSSLERINVNKNNKDLASDSNGVLYSKDYKTIKCYPSGKKVASYQIDSRVEAIDEFAFYNCLNLESLYVPETVTEIPTNSIAYYDLTMFVYRGSAAESYAKSEDIAYKYIGEGKAKNVRVTSEYNLPVIASGEENGSVIGDYDGVAGVVNDSTVNYDNTQSGLQTVTVTYDGETIETQAVVYDPVKEHFFDFGDVKEIQKSERGLAGMFDANGRFLGLSEAIVLEGHETVLIPNEVYEEAVEAKLMVIDAKSFAPTGESVEEGL